MEKGKKSEFPEGQGGEPGVPPRKNLSVPRIKGGVRGTVGSLNRFPEIKLKLLKYIFDTVYFNR